MTTITREQQKQILIDTANHVISRDNTSPYSENLRELARIALASLDAEQIYQYQSGIYNDDNGETDWYWDDCDAGFYKQYAADRRRIVYTAAPAPVVPDERAAFNAWNNEDNLPIAGVGAKNAAWLAWQARASLCGNSALNVPPERPADSSNGDDVEAWFDEGWNACRAAMLHGVDQPQNARQNIPENIPDGNSPAIPDDWVMVPKEPTQAMIKAWLSEVANWRGHVAGYKAALAAAPQHEVK